MKQQTFENVASLLGQSILGGGIPVAFLLCPVCSPATISGLVVGLIVGYLLSILVMYQCVIRDHRGNTKANAPRSTPRAR